MKTLEDVRAPEAGQHPAPTPPASPTPPLSPTSPSSLTAPPAPEPSRSRRGVVVAVVIAFMATAVAIIAATGNATAPRATSTGSTPPVTKTVKAGLDEWSVTLDHVSLSPGKYNFTIANRGKVEHELIAFRTSLAVAALPRDATGHVNEDDPALVAASDGPNLATGTTASRLVDLSTPGSYVFMCNLPAHFGLGMHTVVTVA